MKWKKLKHPGFIEDQPWLLPRYQYRSGIFSIVGPCMGTMNQWELYDDEHIYRADSLKELKLKAKTLCT